MERVERASHVILVATASTDEAMQRQQSSMERVNKASHIIHVATLSTEEAMQKSTESFMDELRMAEEGAFTQVGKPPTPPPKAESPTADNPAEEAEQEPAEAAPKQAEVEQRPAQPRRGGCGLRLRCFVALRSWARRAARRLRAWPDSPVPRTPSDHGDLEFAELRCRTAVQDCVKKAVVKVHLPRVHLPKRLGRASASQFDIVNRNRDASADRWGATRTITEADLVRLVRRITDPAKTLGGVGVSLVRQANGSFNQVYIMQLANSERRAIRVPGRGQVGVWNDDDAADLHNQIMVMKYVRNITALPVPGVFAYDTAHDNEIGYPYMYMEGVAGSNVSSVWAWNHELTPELEAKRLRILRSLATTMTSLRHIEFPALGRLEFDGDDYENPTVAARPANQSSRRYFDDRFCDFSRMLRSVRGGGEDRFTAVKLEAVRMLVEALPCSETNTPADAPPETFVLRAPDFNWQNIMVDDAGDVVAIIDWDGARTVPRFIGWTKPPMFLCADLDPSWTWGGVPGNAPSKLEFYRKKYAEYVAAAMGGSGDCIYTGKSHLYDLVLAALEEPALTSSVLDRLILAAMPRVSWRGIFERVVKRDWAAGEKEFIQERLQLLLRPVAGADHNFTF